MKKLFIEDLDDLKGKKVLVRVDFNVPINDKGVIDDDARIVAALPTIKYLMEKQSKIILVSHLGRPKGEVQEKFSLKPVAEHLAKKIDKKVTFVNDCIGEDVENTVAKMSDGDVVLLENLRFHKEEKKNDSEFAKKLASLADVYVNDAFGTAHRAHASTEGVTKYIDQCASGYLVKKELDYFGEVLTSPKHPFVAILGGAKIAGKIDVIKNLMDKVDVMVIGGGMTYTFLKAKGLEVGKSLLDEDKVSLAKELLEMASSKSVNLMLPVDFVATTEFSEDADTIIVADDKIPTDRMCLDIGPESIKNIENALSDAKTIVWNGPMGVFEMEKFANGTNSVAKMIAKLTEKGATSIIGGGDSASAIKKIGLSDKISHISTGGGASLEYLEGKILPGVAALSDK